MIIKQNFNLKRLINKNIDIFSFIKGEIVMILFLFSILFNLHIFIISILL